MYKTNMQKEISDTPGLEKMEGTVEDLVIEPNPDSQGRRVAGVCLGSGRVVRCKTVIITTGTFLRAKITIGLESFPAGRRGDPPSIGLANTLQDSGFALNRLITGTPPRIDGRTVRYDSLEKQFGDSRPTPFSFLNLRKGIEVDQVLCYLTRTNAATHKIVTDNLHLNRHVLEEVTGPRLANHNLRDVCMCQTIGRGSPQLASKKYRSTAVSVIVYSTPTANYPQGTAVTVP
jgi:tRNA uridine 5-carboxymethylaminomethyl modification enzyme